ncbi:MAG: hypothetical protein ACI9LG_002152, partial [Moritella dasanensis]
QLYKQLYKQLYDRSYKPLSEGANVVTVRELIRG